MNEWIESRRETPRPGEPVIVLGQHRPFKWCDNQKAFISMSSLGIILGGDNYQWKYWW